MYFNQSPAKVTSNIWRDSYPADVVPALIIALSLVGCRKLLLIAAMSDGRAIQKDIPSMLSTRDLPSVNQTFDKAAVRASVQINVNWTIKFISKRPYCLQVTSWQRHICRAIKIMIWGEELRITETPWIALKWVYRRRVHTSGTFLTANTWNIDVKLTVL